jgi:hypothetical protein
MAYLVAGPLVALIGIGAIFFVLRRKSVDKRSMYSARRSQIEHKVRAARQRTLTPHGHAQRAPEPEAAPAPAPTMEQQAVQPTMVYEAPAFSAPPVAPPPAAPPPRPAEPPPWEQPSIPAPASAPSSFDFPSTQPEPFTPAPVEPFRPAPEPTPMPTPSEPAWTPAPEPLPPARTVAPAASVAAATSSTSAGGWSIVSTEKEPAVSAEPSSRKGKKDKDGAPASSSWQLASGEAPGDAAEEPMLRRPSATVMAVAQYAVLVVGLVMVLIGVLVMVANSHVT